MFSLISDNFIDEQENIAKETYVKQDRIRFREIFIIVRNYIYKNDLIESNIDFLLEPEKANDIIYDEDIVIYTVNPYKVGVDLSNLIFTHIGNEVQLNTVVQYNKLQIQFANRRLITLQKITSEKNLQTVLSIIRPIKIQYNYCKIANDNTVSKNNIDQLDKELNLMYGKKKELNILPPDVEMIILYHKLYSPEFYSDYSILKKQVKKLCSTMIYRIQNPLILGAAQKKSSSISIDFKLKTDIMLSLANTENIILGAWGILLKQNNSMNFVKDPKNFNLLNSKIEIISDGDVNKFFNYLTSKIKNTVEYEFFYKKRTTNIVGDTRIEKSTIYIKLKNGKEKNLMDVYNSISYEIVPAIELKTDIGKYLIGSKYVLQRFLLIEFMVIRMLYISKILNNQTIAKLADNVYKKINAVNKFNETPKKYKYKGIYFNEGLYYKINKAKSFQPYYPYVNLVQKGNLLTV